MLQPEINMDNIPAIDNGALRVRRIAGQVEPSKESGKPRLINARYIITSKVIILGPSFAHFITIITTIIIIKSRNKFNKK